jgi:15-cis-phytoene synthase
MKMVTAASLNPELELALSYAPPATRSGVAALFALDAALANVLRSTTEPLLGQMRLTWWWEALNALDHGPAPAEPVLKSIAREVVGHGIAGARIAAMIEGWEALLDEPLDERAIARHGESRGATLFMLAGEILKSADDPLAAAGRGWALADLALHVRDEAVARNARARADRALTAAVAMRWSRQGRTLGALARLAAADLALPHGVMPRRGAPRRVARVAWHRLTGY